MNSLAVKVRNIPFSYERWSVNPSLWRVFTKSGDSVEIYIKPEPNNKISLLGVVTDSIGRQMTVKYGLNGIPSDLSNSDSSLRLEMTNWMKGYAVISSSNTICDIYESLDSAVNRSLASDKYVIEVDVPRELISMETPVNNEPMAIPVPSEYESKPESMSDEDLKLIWDGRLYTMSKITEDSSPELLYDSMYIDKNGKVESSSFDLRKYIKNSRRAYEEFISKNPGFFKEILNFEMFKQKYRNLNDKI